jgi:hypothetical protein
LARLDFFNCPNLDLVFILHHEILLNRASLQYLLVENILVLYIQYMYRIYLSTNSCLRQNVHYCNILCSQGSVYRSVTSLFPGPEPIKH